MKAHDLTALALLIIGGLSWGLVGLFDYNLVAELFGADSAFSNTIYTLVGLSALWALGSIVPKHMRHEATDHTMAPHHS